MAMSKGGSEGGTERHVKGCPLRRTLASIQHTVHKTTHNAALAIETLVLQINNDERVYKLSIAMHRNVLFDRWMT